MTASFLFYYIFFLYYEYILFEEYWTISIMEIVRTIVILISIILSSISLPAVHKNWKVIDELGSQCLKKEYIMLKCADSLNFMIWGTYDGPGGHFFRRTTDGGKTWKEVYRNKGFVNYPKYKFVPRIKDVAYPNTKLFIAVGDSGLIVRSTDNGETWSSYRLDTGRIILRIRMYDDKYGIIIGGPHVNKHIEYYETTDGGLSWNKFANPALFEHTYIHDIALLNRNLFYTSAYYSKGIYPPNMPRVKNNFLEWDTLPKPGDGGLMDFVNEDVGWCAGGKSLDDELLNFTQTVYKTRNAGLSWFTQIDTNNRNRPMEDIRFYNKHYGIVAGSLGQVAMTTDGGESWDYQRIENVSNNSNFDNIIQSVQIPTIDNAYVILDWCRIYKYTRDWQDIQIIGSFQVCESDTIKYISKAIDGYTNKWRLTNGEILETSTDFIRVHWNKSGSGQLKLLRIKETGINKDSLIKNVVILPKPARPTIKDKGNGLLEVEDGYLYQWYFNGKKKYGGTRPYLQAKESGRYSVRIFNKDDIGCGSELSEAIDIVVSVDEKSRKKIYIITPNPAGDYIDIAVVGNRTLKNAVRVYDVLGVCVGTHPLAPSEGGHIRLDVSGLAAGVYFVRVCGKMYKFVKM